MNTKGERLRLISIYTTDYDTTPTLKRIYIASVDIVLYSVEFVDDLFISFIFSSLLSLSQLHLIHV